MTLMTLIVTLMKLMVTLMKLIVTLMKLIVTLMKAGMNVRSSLSDGFGDSSVKFGEIR